MTLLDRHVDFLHALRRAGLPVSLAEGLDGTRAIDALGLADRETLRAAYAATLVKRPSHRPGFDQVFDLYWPALVGDGTTRDQADATDGSDRDGPEQLADLRERIAVALAAQGASSDSGSDSDSGSESGSDSGSDSDSEAALTALAREAVARLGRIRGRGPGEQRWSAYNTLNRLGPDLGPRAERFEALVETEVRRRAAEARGPDHVARHSVRPAVDQLDISSASRAELELMRREIQPLARRLATRLHREQRHRRRGPLDFRRTVRASMSSGGVPLTTHHRPRRPGRPDLVVLCDVSGSVASFAGFTLMLVFALREQFDRVRAFTFVDDVHEVTGEFAPGADPAEVMARLAASAAHASRFGRTQYGRALTRFAQDHADALTPRTHLLVLGDARSNYGDLALPVMADLVHAARRSWWLNPEHPRHWGTGDSGAPDYAALLPMVECRNLTQLAEFVHDLA